MTTSTQGPAQPVSMAGAPPIPPPHVSRGAAAGALPGYVPPRGERSAPRWRIPGGANNRKRIAALAAAAALALALVLLLAGVFKSGSHVTDIQAPPTARAAAQAQAGLRQPGVASVSGQAPFVVHYPSDWTRLTSAQLARIANPPAAGLIAEGGKVLLFVRPEKPLTQPLSTLAVQLTESLRRRFADFKLLSTGTTRTLAGPAWVYTFARTAHQLVQSEVVISTPSAAYELDITLRGSADRAARQMGEIVHSFQA